MRRIVALAAIVLAIVVLANGPTFAGDSQPAAAGLPNQLANQLASQDASDATTAQSLAALIPVRPLPSYSIPQASKPIPAACVDGGNPCSNNAQCCSGVCKRPADGWAGRGRYCSSAD